MVKTNTDITTIYKIPSKLMNKLYNWTLHWSKTRYAELALFIISFAESSFFPIPPDILLLTIIISKPKKYIRLFLIATLGSIMGAVLGYYIGFALFELIGEPIVELYHLQDEISSIGKAFSNNATFTVLLSSFTPIPYEVISISAGLFKINLLQLIVLSLLGRGARFFLVSYLVHKFGPKIKELIEKYFDILGLGVIVAVILGFILLKII